MVTNTRVPQWRQPPTAAEHINWIKAYQRSVLSTLLLLISLFVHKVQQQLTASYKKYNKTKRELNTACSYLKVNKQTNKQLTLINAYSSEYDKRVTRELIHSVSHANISNKTLAVRNWEISTVILKYELTMLNELNNKLFNGERYLSVSNNIFCPTGDSLSAYIGLPQGTICLIELI